MKYFGTIAVCCLEMMGEERGVCVEQSPVLSHRASLGGTSGGGLAGLGGGGVVSISRMRPSHSSQNVASISHEQDYWEYGPGIVDRLKSKFINLSMNNQLGGQNGLPSHSAGKRNHLRSCASLENLQEGTGPYSAGNGGAFHKVTTTPSSVGGIGATMNTTHKLLMTSPANMRHHETRRNPLVPKSPSMEILLDANRHYESHNLNGSNNNNNKTCADGSGNHRTDVVSSSMSSVVESELPRRDTVRKYKTFFEQTSTSSSPQHLSNGSIHQPSAPSHLTQKGSGSGILRNNKTSPIKKPVANIKPLRKEQPPPEPEARDSPPLNKYVDNKDNNISICPGVYVSSTPNRGGTEAALNEINLQVNATGGHSYPSPNAPTATATIASPDIMSINCGSDNRPQSSSTPVTSRQMASGGTQQQLLSSAGLGGSGVPEPRTPSLIVKPRACPLLLSESNSRPLAGCTAATSTAASLGSMGNFAVGSLTTSCTSMVFDFRGKDVKPQVAVMPSPVKLPSREELDGLEDGSDASGITFIGENVVVGGGSLISTRNKKLSIRFDEQNLSSFFEYEAEDDDDDAETDEDAVDDYCGSGEGDASESTARGLPSAILGNYKPGVLSSEDEDFQLGVSRLRRQQQSLAQVSTDQEATDDDQLQAKPAAHDETSVYSQVGSSDLLF